MNVRQRLLESENLGQVLLATTTGLIGGAGAIVFRHLVELARRIFFDGGETAFSFLGDSYVILLPVIGMLIVSTIVRRWAPEAEGHGVPEVMYAVKREGGRIRPRVVVVKALASSICIGSGGSVGREGPIVQIGAATGSTFGQLLKLREDRVRLLVACGAAAGIAGTFNAPIGGVIFALEIILGRFSARYFGLVVLSSVASTAVCHAALGKEPSFALVQVFSLVSPAELLLYAVLGLMTGLTAVGFVQFLSFLETVFSRWRWHPLLKAGTAGLGAGLIGWFSMQYLGGPFLFGVGYDGIGAALSLTGGEALDWSLGGGLTVTALVLLAVLKIPATSLILAGGGSGGVFAPSIFIGAMVGGAFGIVVNTILPGTTAPAGAYALVGMGASFAGTAHAPVTSVLILFEMTDDYQIILPLMIAVGISYLVASRADPDSVYTIKLRRRGGLAPPMPKTSVLDQIVVADAMSTDFQAIGKDESVERLAADLHGSHVRCFFVVDDDRKLKGIVTEYDVETALMAGDVTKKHAEDIMTRELITATPSETMSSVLRHFSSKDVGQVPVVAGDDSDRVVGVLKRREILWAYGQLALEHRKMLLESVQELPTDHGDAVHVKLEVTARHQRLAYKRIQDIRVPDQCLIVVLLRGGRPVVPRGSTVVEPGDVLTLMTIRAREPGLRQWVASATST